MTDMCPAQHCSSQQGDINQMCKMNGWQVNHLVMVCNDGQCCFCTCSCLAFNTPVAQGDNNEKAIQNFLIGDPVLAYNPDGTTSVRSVAFSNGTNEFSVQPEMAYLTFTAGEEERSVIVTLNHTFVLANERKLIQAQLLAPGTEILMASGAAGRVTSIDIQPYTGGVWNISTSIGEPISLDGHLINTNGILSGDFAVQLYYEELATKGLAVVQSSVPAVNSKAHDKLVREAYDFKGLNAARENPPTKSITQFLNEKQAVPTSRSTAPGQRAGGVVLQGDHSFVLELPDAGESNMSGFLTDAQALEVSLLIQHDSIRDSYKAGQVMWLLTLFEAFYPDITYTIDLPNRGGNAFAFKYEGQKFIAIQGGLIRAANFEWQGMALVIGYLVSLFNEDAETYGEDGFVCKPWADYLAPATMQTVFNPLYPTVIFDAIDQVSALFERIPTKADVAVKGCHETSLSCRAMTYHKSIGFDGLPECAGGKPPILLQVTGATLNTDGTVTVTFSEKVERESAETIANYFFSPPSVVTSIKNPDDATHAVVITGEWHPGTTTKVEVTNVVAASGAALDPNANTAEFTVPIT